MKKRHLQIAISSALLCIAAVLLAAYLFEAAPQGVAIVKASAMPVIVERPVDELLDEIEGLMREKAPGAYAALRPGIAPEALAEPERQYNVTLTDDMKALYLRHDGCDDGPYGASRPFGMGELIPQHRFVPLGEALEVRQSLRDTPILWEREILHQRLNGLLVSDDGAGDGYFLEPTHSASEGVMLYSFLETGVFTCFPSVGNLLAGAIECFQQDAFFRTEADWEDEEVRDRKFDVEVAIRAMYGVGNGS